MIAMSMTRTHHEHRRDADRARAGPSGCRALSMFGLGGGGVAAMDDDEPLGIG